MLSASPSGEGLILDFNANPFKHLKQISYVHTMTLQGLYEHIVEDLPGYAVTDLPGDAIRAVITPFRAALRLAVRDSRPVVAGGIPYLETVLKGEIVRLEDDPNGNELARVRIFWRDPDLRDAGGD